MKIALKLFALAALPLFSAWAEAALASKSQGHLGFFGLGRQTAYGTAVAVTDYLELLSESLSTGIDRFPTRNIFNGRYEPDDYAGLRRSGGSIVHAAHPVSLGHLLRAGFYNHSVSAILSGFLWNIHVTGLRSEFAAETPLTPYTLEVNRNISSGSHRYADAVLNRLTMALAPNQDLRITGEWIARSRAMIAATTPTFPGSSANPFTFEASSLQLAGAAISRIEALQVSIDNQIEAVPSLNGTNEIAYYRQSGPQLIRISGTLDFADNAQEADFVDQTERALILTLTRAQSFALHIEAPRFVYDAFPMGQAGRGRNTVGFSGMARYLASSLSAFRMMLTTTKSNY